MLSARRRGGEATVKITEIRVKLLEDRADRLRAFCSITMDDEFVVHDLRVIDGRSGLFVAMPSRKLSDNCPRCGAKNHLRAKFCSECGARLDESRASGVERGHEKFHVDVAHPISPECRERVQSAVLAAYQKACQSGKGEGTDFVCKWPRLAEEEEEYGEMEPEPHEVLAQPHRAAEEPEEYDAAGPKVEEAPELLEEEQVEGGQPEPEPKGRQEPEEDTGRFGEGIL